MLKFNIFKNRKTIMRKGGKKGNNFLTSTETKYKNITTYIKNEYILFKAMGENFRDKRNRHKENNIKQLIERINGFK